MLRKALLGTGFGALLSVQLACQPNTVSKNPNVALNRGIEDVTTSAPAKKSETCFTPAEACDVKLIQFLKTATKTLDIAIYSITHPEIVRAIIETHHKGVEVRIVADRIQAFGNSSMVDELHKDGIPIKIGNTGRAIMHHKFAIVDGVGLETGSFNYTRNASFENSENQLYIYDTEVIQSYQKDFETLWSSALQPEPPKAKDTDQ